MRKYEYKVVPVPSKCISTRGVGKEADPAAHTIETILNDHGVEGWEYIRTDSVTIRDGGIFSRGEMTRDMLVFRRHPVTLTDREPAEERAPVREVQEFAQLPSPEQIRARRVKRPELLEGAKTGRRRITPRPVLTDQRKSETPAMAAE